MSSVKGVLLQVTHDVHKLQHHEGLENVIIGRSNAGKSTLINKIMGQKIAKTSQSPGKTRTYNIYYNHDQYWVDLPGVGYAKVSHTELDTLKNRVRDYFLYRKELTLVVHCMDIRHPWLAWDDVLWDVYGAHTPAVWILTKSDKISKQQALNILHKARLYRDGHYIMSGEKTAISTILHEIKQHTQLYKS